MTNLSDNTDKSFNTCQISLLNPKILTFLIIIFPLLFIWQGLDFTDMGYALVNSQQIFNDPFSIQYGIGTWLTNIIGGTWLYLFNDLAGLIGFRFASVLIVYATIAFAYFALKPYYRSEYILAGLLFAEIFIHKIYWINYNNLTALFFVIVSFFMIKGFEKGNKIHFFISGLFVGFNIFIRISNILGLALILCIFAHGYWSNGKVKESINRSLIFVTGFLISMLIVFGLMISLGHFELFISSIFDLLLNHGMNSSSHHSFGLLLTLFIRDHLQVLLLFFSGLLGFILLSKAYSQFDRHSRTLSTGLLILVFLLSLGISLSLHYLSLFYIAIKVLYGFLCFALLISIAWKDAENSSIRSISLIALLVLFISPLGSGNGVINSIYGMWLALPIGFIFLVEREYSCIEFKLQKFEAMKKVSGLFSTEKTGKIVSLILVSFLCFSLIGSYQYTYRDSEDRQEMVHPVINPYLKGVYTTEMRARVVQGLSDVLPRYIQKNDYVLAYEHIPMIHYLSGSRPYLGNSWPDLYMPDVFEKELSSSLAEKGIPSVIVRAKYSTREFEWPERKVISDKEFELIRRELMERFIADHGYSLAWNNDFFEIYTPKNSRQS